MVGRATHYCPRCEQPFDSRNDLMHHMRNHEEQKPRQLTCVVCHFNFSDSKALEKHSLLTGHDTPAETANITCDVCKETFETQAQLSQHCQFPSKCSDFKARSRQTSGELPSPATVKPVHRSPRGYIDSDAPKVSSGPNYLPYEQSPSPTEPTVSSVDDKIYCHYCKSTFPSQAKFQRHGLFCAVQNRPAPAYENVDTTFVKSCYAKEVTQGMSGQSALASRAPYHAPMPGTPTSGAVAREEMPITPISEIPSAATSAPAAAPVDKVFDAQKPAATPADKAPVAHRPAVTPADKASVAQKSTAPTIVAPKTHQPAHPPMNKKSAASAPKVSAPSTASGSSKFVCSVGTCGAQFRSGNDLAHHQQSSHSFCNLGCGKYLMTEAGFTQHIKSKHHSASITESDARSPKTRETPFQHGRSDQRNVCDVLGCGRSFQSLPALAQHRKDNHSIGGAGLDLSGKDSWMLSSQARQMLQNRGGGSLRSPSSRAPRRNLAADNRAGSVPATHITPKHFTQAPRPVQQHFRPPFHVPMAHASANVPMQPLNAAAILQVNVPMNILPVSGPADVEQANLLTEQIKRLLIPADITINHDGKIVHNGNIWKRIGVAKQPDVVAMVEKLIHLPKALQSEEYVPPPKTLRDEYVADYAVSEFEPLPAPRFGTSGASVIVLYCSKIILDNGYEEAVKVAAVDLLTGRPLLNYYSCTDPTAIVKDWRTASTGLYQFADFETARQNKFKVLKGWKAARAALGTFANKNTIIVGYNLRSDLDAMRIVHGRAVDLIKCLEKAASGPLSKNQLLLDKLARDLAQVQPAPRPQFGRDCLQDAYAIREAFLWTLKHNDEFIKYAKQKSRDYQKVSGM